MAPILISWASAEPPSNAAASTPKHSFAVADLIKSSLGANFLGFKCAEGRAGLSMAPRCRSVPRFRAGPPDDECVRGGRLPLHPGGLPVFGRRRGGARLRDRARALSPAGATGRGLCEYRARDPGSRAA